MSLTSLLRTPDVDVRKRFGEEFPKPKVLLQGVMRAPPRSPTRAGLVGTVLDYAMRAHVAIINDTVEERRWVAAAAVERLRADVRMRRPLFPPGSRRGTRGLVRKAADILAGMESVHCRRLQSFAVHPRRISRNGA
jgi:hypothetical protein